MTRGLEPAHGSETADDRSGLVVRSLADWHRRIDDHMTTIEPLRKLTPGELAAFGRSLVFRNGGLAGANYTLLADRLTYFEMEAVLGEFGIEMLQFEGMRDYLCLVLEDGHTVCQVAPGFFCTDYC